MTSPLFEPEPGKDKEAGSASMPPALKLSLETGPLVIFFLANFFGQWLIDHVPLFSSFEKPIFPATALFMIAIISSLATSWLLARRVLVMPLVSGVFVLIFGSLTLWLQDATFVKIKPTITSILFALILFGGLLFKKSLLGYVFDSAFQLDAEGWRKLTFRWAFFFLFLALINEIIWRNFSDDFWTNFHVFANTLFTFIFLATQIPLIIRHSLEQPLSNKKKDHAD